MINVTKTYLPPLEEYVEYLQGIWERNWVTNHGPLVKELEARLKEFLEVKHLFLVNNGTIALQIAIKALDLQGEIITTPFSYVATTSSIVVGLSAPAGLVVMVARPAWRSSILRLFTLGMVWLCGRQAALAGEVAAYADDKR